MYITYTDSKGEAVFEMIQSVKRLDNPHAGYHSTVINNIRHICKDYAEDHDLHYDILNNIRRQTSRMYNLDAAGVLGGRITGIDNWVYEDDRNVYITDHIHVVDNVLFLSEKMTDKSTHTTITFDDDIGPTVLKFVCNRKLTHSPRFWCSLLDHLTPPAKDKRAQAFYNCISIVGENTSWVYDLVKQIEAVDGVPYTKE